MTAAPTVISRSAIMGDPTLRKLGVSVAFVIFIIATSLITAVVITARSPVPPVDAVYITACPPGAFDDNLGSCPPGVPVDPDVNGPVVYDPEMQIRVAGDVVVDEALVEVAYTVTVSWVSADSTRLGPPGTSFVALSTPLTWEPDQRPYSVAWTPPRDMVAAIAAAGFQPGESMGRWRIVGTASPVMSERFAVHQWDSVETFAMVSP